MTIGLVVARVHGLIDARRALQGRRVLSIEGHSQRRRSCKVLRAKWRRTSEALMLLATHEVRLLQRTQLSLLLC